MTYDAGTERRIHVSGECFSNTLGLVVYERDYATRKVSVMRNATFEELPPGALPPTDCQITLGKDAANELVEGLWRQGLRPKDQQHTSETVQVLRDEVAFLRLRLAESSALIAKLAGSSQ